VFDEMGDAVPPRRLVPGTAVDEKAEGKGVKVRQFFGNDGNAGADLFLTNLIPCE